MKPHRRTNIIAVSILIFSMFVFSSCNKTNIEINDNYLSNIMKYYRENKMKTWQDVLAVYNAGENPIDYAGYDEILAKTEEVSDNNFEDMASYLIIAGISVEIGAQIDYYEQIEDYGKKLIDFMQSEIYITDTTTIELYCIAFYGLRMCQIEFDSTNFIDYIKNNSPDLNLTIDETAFLLPILYDEMQKNTDDSTLAEVYHQNLSFLFNGTEPNGTFCAYEKENAVSTSKALSALIFSRSDTGQQIITTVKKGLSRFTIKSEDGFSFEEGKKRDDVSTAYGAIALGDLKNNSSLLYFMLTYAEES